MLTADENWAVPRILGEFSFPPDGGSVAVRLGAIGDPYLTISSLAPGSIGVVQP